MQCKRACPLYPRKRHQMRHMECPLRAKSGHRAAQGPRRRNGHCAGRPCPCRKTQGKRRALVRSRHASLFTGMRRGEVLALRWGCVDLDGKVIKVRQAIEPTETHGIRFKAPKSKAGRRDITLPDILVRCLARLSQGAARVAPETWRRKAAG